MITIYFIIIVFLLLIILDNNQKKPNIKEVPPYKSKNKAIRDQYENLIYIYFKSAALFCFSSIIFQWTTEVIAIMGLIWGILTIVIHLVYYRKLVVATTKEKYGENIYEHHHKC